MFTGFAVVELFTSEGCATCPSADQLMVRLSKEYAGRTVYFLGFHVDYWDANGWKDQYSNHSFSERQQYYDQLFHVAPYAPQVIINGKKEIAGGEAEGVRSIINRSVKSDMPENAISFSASFQGSQLMVNYNLHHASVDDLLNVALVQEHGSSKITAGANKGTIINQANIVRVFKTLKGQLSGKIPMDIPADMIGGSFRLILFVQNKADGHITAGNTVILTTIKKVVTK